MKGYYSLVYGNSSSDNKLFAALAVIWIPAGGFSFSAQPTNKCKVLRHNLLKESGEKRALVSCCSMPRLQPARFDFLLGGGGVRITWPLHTRARRSFPIRKELVSALLDLTTFFFKLLFSSNFVYLPKLKSTADVWEEKKSVQSVILLSSYYYYYCYFYFLHYKCYVWLNILKRRSRLTCSRLFTVCTENNYDNHRACSFFSVDCVRFPLQAPNMLQSCSFDLENSLLYRNSGCSAARPSLKTFFIFCLSFLH